MSVACDVCEKPARVQCDCFGAFCAKCFKSHHCGNEHLAQFSSGVADYSEEVAEVVIDPNDLLRALPMRPYQEAAYKGVLDQFAASNRTLVVLPTGMGKTVLFGHVAANWGRGRVLIMAHRDELIRQAADKVGRIVGEECDIEMGDDFADRGSLYRRSHVVVTSVQTMCRPRRHGRFRPDDFGLVVIDEAHHAVADTYKKVIAHFAQNPKLKVLGVTATPDRADEAALGQVFDSVAFDYQINDGINDGWLSPIDQRFFFVEGLDFSRCGTIGGDLNGADLERVMLEESILHKVVDPTLQLVGDRKTLVFASSVQHADRMCEIANRHREGCAAFVHGGTPIEERRDILKRYSAGQFQFLYSNTLPPPKNGST